MYLMYGLTCRVGHIKCIRWVHYEGLIHGKPIGCLVFVMLNQFSIIE